MDRSQSAVVALLTLAAGLTGLFVAPSSARAQTADQPASSGVTFGGFATQGSVSVGYRTIDVTGYEPKYRELYDLDDGLRVPDVNFFGRAPKGRDLFADTFSFSASGLGGDPYETVQATARKNGLYDLRVSFRRSNFFWDESDATLPTGADGLTSNHAWNTERTFGSVDFLLHATNALRLGFEFGHSARDGENLTTRSLDFFGSPASWGSFTRANPYSILAPLHEDTSRYAAGFDYTRLGWNVHYRAGYEVFDDAVTADALTTPEVSINVDDLATSTEVLQQGAYQDYRRLTTPLSEFSYDGALAPKLHWRGGYTFHRYTGPAGLQATYDGTARSNASGSAIAPYTLSFATRAEVAEPLHVLDQGVTWEANDWMTLLIDYRYERIDIDSAADFTTLFNGAATTGETVNQWREHRHQIDVDLEFMPRANLLIRAGVRDLRNDVRVTADGVLDDTRTQRIDTWWPTASVSWKPDAILDVRADVDAISNDVSYTLLTPHTDVGTRVLVSVHPNDQFSIVDAMNVRHQTLDAADYTADIRGNAVTANYQVNDNFAFFGGYTFDSLKATGSTTFLRGTPPLTETIEDDTVNHVWQAGVSAKLLRRLGVNVAGNYIRTTGEGTITGETPLYGPLRYPYVTGTVSYEFPTVGQLSVDVSHASYNELLVPLNNFNARIVMIRWTRSF